MACRCGGDVTAAVAAAAGVAAGVVYAFIDPTPTTAGACDVVNDDVDVLCGNNDTVPSCDGVCVDVADAEKSLAVVLSLDCGTYVDVAGVYFSFLECHSNTHETK